MNFLYLNSFPRKLRTLDLNLMKAAVTDGGSPTFERDDQQRKSVLFENFLGFSPFIFSFYDE